MRKLLLALSSIFLYTNAFAYIAVGEEVGKKGYGFEKPASEKRSEAVNANLKPYIIAGGLGKATGTEHGTQYNSWGIVGLFPYKYLSDTGMYLCPTQLECHANENAWWYTYTRYYRPKNFISEEENCFYVCKDGYTYSTSKKTCVPTSTLTAYECNHDSPETLANAGGITMATSTSTAIETDIMMFSSGNTSEPYDEWDRLPVVTRFVEHGVMIVPMLIQCTQFYNADKQDYIIYANSRAKTETLLCMPGYKPNAAKTACELIDANKCDVTALAKCNTNDNRTFDSATHKWIVGPNGNCRIQVCADNTKAFESDASTNCIPCGDGTKAYGINTYGVCVKCSAGELFSDKTFKCEPGIRLSKTDMLYGRGKTKTTADAQCWQILDAGIYRQCITSACEVGKKWTTEGCVEIKPANESK